MPDPVKILLFGAGNRGADAYGPFALEHPEAANFVAVAEPNPIRREKFARIHQIPPERQFEGWQQALAAGNIADAVLNATQDNLHAESAMAALKAGYDLLLEKPIAPTLKETLAIVQTAEANQRTLVIAHVLRFTDFFQKVKEILASGRLGQVINISHAENVSYFHMAHSYVRGNWRNTDFSAPMILAKCCHDLDLLYWFLAEKPHWLSSFGSLRHFRVENAPPGAPDRCTDGCPAADTCPYFAPRIYRDSIPIKEAVSKSRNPFYRFVGYLTLKAPKAAKALGKVMSPIRTLTEYQGWPRSTITETPQSDAAVIKALQTGPYGRCVYRCDNNVVDHQVVSLTFESGITATLTMHGHSHEEGRTLRIDGSLGTLLGKFSLSRAYLEVYNHANGCVEKFNFPTEIESSSGHGGGDSGLMAHFINVLRGKCKPITTASEALESHLLAFAAEESRLGNKVIDLKAYRKALGIHEKVQI